VSFRPSTATYRRLPVKWRHFQVTSGHLRSCDVIYSHVTASYSELQRCRIWNVQYTWVFGILQQLTGDFRSNDIPSRSLPVILRHVQSFTVTSLPPAVRYSLVGGEMYSLLKFSALYSHFQVTSSQMTSLEGQFQSPEVT